DAPRFDTLSRTAGLLALHLRFAPQQGQHRALLALEELAAPTLVWPLAPQRKRQARARRRSSQRTTYE
ncbi:MAG TPA: hypothetical protein PLY80_21200, partial [Pseudomonadota bacterium]|nr:hypothetical protein [Pseudomonadota bacterium]